MFSSSLPASKLIPPIYGGSLPPALSSPGTRASDPLPVLRATIDQVPQGVMLLSETGRIVHANPAAPAIFGYCADELVGLDFGSLVPGDSVNPLKHFWISLKPCRMGMDRPLSGRKKDGSPVFLELGLNVVPTADSRLVVACVVDVTRQHDLEDSLAAADDESLGFQRLMADFTFQLAGAEPHSIDDQIAASLHKIAEALNLDGAIVWQPAAGRTSMVPTHHWMRFSTPLPEQLAVDELPWVIARLRAGEPACFASPEDLQQAVDREALRHFALQTLVMFPMAQGGSRSKVPGAVMFGSTADRPWPTMTIERLRLASLVIGQALALSVSQAAVQRGLAESSRLGDRGRDEIADVRRNGTSRISRAGFSESEPVRRAYEQLELVAPTPSTVLLLGETGSGKEVFAQAIHDLSPRHQRPMIRVSCAAIPSALIESELFGRERGAYTGAVAKQIGRFEAADRSTLFLDEIGELPAEVQVKLLRVLQERVIERLGSPQTFKVDVRIIAATNRNLEKAVENKTFREDLYYRLNVFPIVVPPLRERLEDIPALVWAFVDEFSKSFGKTIESIPKDTMQELQSYSWPGNIRELRNVVERAVIVAKGPRLTIPLPKPASASASQTAQTLEELEATHIRSVLEVVNWRVRGRSGAAERLGLKPTTLESRMARLGIRRPA